MKDFFHQVIVLIISLGLDLDAFSDENLLNILDKSELMKLALSFKLPTKNASKKAIIESLLKSARVPSLLKFFSSSNTASKSRLRTL